MSAQMEEEIHGFSSLDEFRKFSEHLSTLVLEGKLAEVNADPNYGHNLIFGGRWFEIIATKAVWRLVPPDFPFRGLWEPVKPQHK